MDFCAKHQIVPKTKLIKAAELDEVFEALEKGNDQVIDTLRIYSYNSGG